MEDSLTHRMLHRKMLPTGAGGQACSKHVALPSSVATSFFFLFGR